MGANCFGNRDERTFIRDAYRLRSDSMDSAAFNESAFLQESYPGCAALKVSGHRPQIMFSGHVRPGLDASEVVDHLISRGYRALLNIQESWEPEYQDLEAASTAKGLVYIHIPVPYTEGTSEQGELSEEKLTLDLARQIGLVVLVLPQPLMIMCRTAKRASAVWFFNYVVRRNLSSAQVMMLTASARLGFASEPALLYWVGRFMMMVDTERARNRMVFGDVQMDGSNEVDKWDPTPHLDLADLPSRESTASSEYAQHTRRPSTGGTPKISPLNATLVTGPDGMPQTHGDTLAGWELESPCPFSHVVFPGFIDSELGCLGKGDSGGVQCTFGRLRMGGFARCHGAAWLVEKQYRSVLNLGHWEDIDWVDFGEDARRQGLEYMHIPVEDADTMTGDYSLNLARIIVLSILGMPRPLMIVSGGMRRASAAWTLAHATRWELGSGEVQRLSLSSELNFTLSPKLSQWVGEFMKVADAAVANGGKVLGDIEITGRNLAQWHLDLSTRPFELDATDAHPLSSQASFRLDT